MLALVHHPQPWIPIQDLEGKKDGGQAYVDVVAHGC
jgi:hypothetical protein